MNRRGFLGAILAAGVAPAVVKASSLMPWLAAERYEQQGDVLVPRSVAADINALAAALDAEAVPLDGRFLVVSPEMAERWAEGVRDGTIDPLRSGTIGRVERFSIYTSKDLEDLKAPNRQKPKPRPGRDRLGEMVPPRPVSWVPFASLRPAELDYLAENKALVSQVGGGVAVLSTDIGDEKACQEIAMRRRRQGIPEMKAKSIHDPMDYPFKWKAFTGRDIGTVTRGPNADPVGFSREKEFPDTFKYD